MGVLPARVAVQGALPLSVALRTRTQAAHAQAERSPYMAALIGGRVTAAGLAALLSRLLPVYEALEAVAADWAADAVVGCFVRPELHRSARLRADLQHLTGRAQGAATPAAVAYADRVAQVGRRSAAAFVAHHYTRYLGDLSGGQLIGTSLGRSLGIADGCGASFFAFPGVQAGECKQQYRRWLDDAPFSSAEHEELLDEALVAYGCNLAVAAELDADLSRWTA